jgi:hypothetical protein
MILESNIHKINLAKEGKAKKGHSHFVSFSPSQLEQTSVEMWHWLKESPSSDCFVHHNIGKISILKRQRKHGFEILCGKKEA